MVLLYLLSEHAEPREETEIEIRDIFGGCGVEAFADAKDFEAPETVGFRGQVCDAIVAQIELPQPGQPSHFHRNGIKPAAGEIQHFHSREFAEPGGQDLDLVLRQHELARGRKSQQFVRNEAQFARLEIHLVHEFAAFEARRQRLQTFGSHFRNRQGRRRADLSVRSQYWEAARQAVDDPSVVDEIALADDFRSEDELEFGRHRSPPGD